MLVGISDQGLQPRTYTHSECLHTLTLVDKSCLYKEHICISSDKSIITIMFTTYTYVLFLCTTYIVIDCIIGVHVCIYSTCTQGSICCKMASTFTSLGRASQNPFSLLAAAALTSASGSLRREAKDTRRCVFVSS